METLKSKDLHDFNSISNPPLIYLLSKQLAITGKKINIALDPISVNIVILKLKK